jgi:hypothetical protein
VLRRKLAALLTGASIGLVGLVGTASPASATTTTGVGTQAAVVAASSTEFARRSWVHRWDYEHLWECKEHGEQLILAGIITNYSCQYRRGVYELWVIYA